MIAFLSHDPPPSANSIDRETCSIVIRADADPTNVVVDVVDAVGHGALKFGIDKIVHLDGGGVIFGAPFFATVLEIAYDFLLFCID